MLSTKVNDTLAILQKTTSFIFGKYFLQSLVSGKMASCLQITLNYHDDLALGKGLGVLAVTGLSPKVMKEGEYSFTIDGKTLVLRKNSTVCVTDFDPLGYDAKSGEFYYDGQPLSDELRANFGEMKCTLLFNPYEKQDDSVEWTAKRKTLLSYLRQGWTFLDSLGREVKFLNEEREMQLNATRPWIAMSMPTPVSTPTLTLEGFREELQTLIAKYAEVFTTLK